ncbi:MAG: hypothetical protein IIB68_03320 [Proteobacteria bacterium]|nr:hypothetical protein [Pseudomonadota bacterium]
MFDIPFDVQGNSTNLEGADFTVTLQLIGNDLFDDPNAVWLPDSNSDEAKEYPMISSWITGGTVKGVHPRKSCVSKGGTEIMDLDPDPDPDPNQDQAVHMLKIKATQT